MCLSVDDHSLEMTKTSGDRWLAGDAYEAYMGRWSRRMARAFVEWVRPTPLANWLELGCGTGALTSAICDVAVASIRERLRRGGTCAAYVWDYAEGLEFLRVFWDEAIALDPPAAALDEGRRFPLCEAPALASLFRAGGLAEVETGALEMPTDFTTFEDYWMPFLGGTGPAPSYVASLDAGKRERLRKRLERRLRPGLDGGITLGARAWAVRGVSFI